LFRCQRRIALGRVSLSECLCLLGFEVRLRGKFGGTGRLRSKFGGTHFLCGFAFGTAESSRLIQGYPFKALLFESWVLASGAKLLQHLFFYSGGIIPTL
jgi:hypothetical protein